MATQAIIQSVGSVSGAGTPGVGRNDLDIWPGGGETITLSDTEASNTGFSHYWVLEDIPIGSSATLTDPTATAPTFDVDVTGSYRISCLVAGKYTSYLVVSVPLATTGSRIPSFEEKLEYNGGGNTKGWHEALTTFMRTIDSMVGASIGVVRMGEKTIHDSATPLAVSQISFDPTLYGAPTLKFRAVAANGNTPLTTHVRLYNLTDAETVATLNFTTTTATLAEATLTIGSGAGNIKTSAKIYETRIYVDSPALPIDTITLGSAEIQVTP